MRKYIHIIFFVLSFSCFSQVGGERIFNFLNVTTSARQAALGGEVLTLQKDVNQPLWNPAIITNDLDNQVSLNYMDFLADVNYGSATFAHVFTRRMGTIHAGVTYVNYGEFIAADETGMETGTFKARDLAFQIGYAYALPIPNFSVGANIKFISSVIDNFNANGLAGDLALVYHNEFKPYMFTAVVRNIGYQITAFEDEKEKLPLEVAFGASYQLKNLPLQWHITLNNLQQWKVAVPNPSNGQATIDGGSEEESITFLDNAFRHVAVGAEFFPEKGFNLRLGYNFRRGSELRLSERRTFAGFTAGFGLKMGRFKLNYAFSKFHPASNTNTFSLNIDLAKTGFKRH